MLQVDRSNRRSRRSRVAMFIGAIAASCALTGCGVSYRTPGGPADFHALGITSEEVVALTDEGIAARLERKPLAGFPASIAVVRVQDHGYYSHSTRGYGRGRYSVVTTRDVETDEAFDQIASLPMIEGIAPVNRLILPGELMKEDALRHAAATLQADMVLVYTFDTQFETRKKVAPLGLITLGMFPDRVARISCTASAALLDTRNGYVYGVAESTGSEQQLTNAWNNEDAIDSSRRKAEQQAFDHLVDEFATLWKSVVDRYAAAPRG